MGNGRDGQDETDSIVRFLYSWWTDLIKHKSYFDNEAFCIIFKLTGDIDQLLDRWAINFTDNSFLNFVDLIYNYYDDLTGRRENFGEFDESSIKKLLQWIEKNSDLVEQGFFQYADKGEELAEKISVTHYIFGGNKNRNS